MRARHTTRWIASSVAVLLVAFGVVLAVQHRSEASVPLLVQEHKQVPEFSLETLDGTRMSAQSLAGKTYVVNFWNSWCIPCHEERAALQAFYENHRREPDFEMLGIVRDDESGPIREYVEDHSIAWPVAFDPDGSAGLGFGTTGQPETYVISPGGVAACGALGPVTLAELEIFLRAARAGGTCA